MILGDKLGSVEDLRSLPTRSVFWEVLQSFIQNADKINIFESIN